MPLPQMPSWKSAFLSYEETLEISKDNVACMILPPGGNKRAVQVKFYVFSTFKIYIAIQTKAMGKLSLRVYVINIR